MVENVIPVGMYRTEDHAYDPVEVWNRMLDASEWRGKCRVWARSTKNGYGILSVANRHEYAHRMAYRLWVGPIPEGIFVCHTCDNPPCFNPKHLFLGTHAENLQDASRKGRMHPGSRHGMAKLTEKDIPTIRMRLALGDLGTSIARDFGVHANTIYSIKKGRTWLTI